MPQYPSVGGQMEAYGAKMVAGSDYVPPITAAKLALMKRKLRAELSWQNDYLQRAKALLDLVGVSMLLYASYLAFARELARVVQRHSGETAAVEAELLIVKWIARGLTRSVLESIRTGVFNVSDPASP